VTTRTPIILLLLIALRFLLICVRTPYILLHLVL
jgi:hypothetical protein